jgi:hypothetical protein
VFPSTARSARIRMLMHGIITAALLLISVSGFADELPFRPDAKLTPGAVLTTDTATVCQPGYAKSVRHTSGRLKAQVYRAYGIDRANGHFEVDPRLVVRDHGGATFSRMRLRASQLSFAPKSCSTMPIFQMTAWGKSQANRDLATSRPAA